MARAIAASIRALGFSRWRIVGHSLGGTLALHLASVEPDATTGIVLVSPSTFGVAAAVSRPSRGLRRLPAFVGMHLAMRAVAATGPIGRGVVRGLGRSGMMRLLGAPLVRHPSYVDASVFRALGEEIRGRSFTLAADAIAGYPMERSWAGIRRPVTVIRGGRDVFVAGDDLDHLRRVLPHLRTEVWDNAGHFAHVEDPFGVLDAVIRSARRAEGRGPQGPAAPAGPALALAWVHAAQRPKTSTT